MIFTVKVKSPSGRINRIYYDSSNFEELLKKIFVIHGKNFVEVSYEVRKNAIYCAEKNLQELSSIVSRKN